MRVTGAQPVIGAWTPIQACRVQVTPLWVPQDAAASDGEASDKVPCLDSCCVPAHASGVDRTVCPIASGARLSYGIVGCWALTKSTGRSIWTRALRALGES